MRGLAGRFARDQANRSIQPVRRHSADPGHRAPQENRGRHQRPLSDRLLRADGAGLRKQRGANGDNGDLRREGANLHDQQPDCALAKVLDHERRLPLQLRGGVRPAGDAGQQKRGRARLPGARARREGRDREGRLHRGHGAQIRAQRVRFLF